VADAADRRREGAAVTDPSDRHVSFSTLDDYILANVLVTLPIDGEPAASLTIDAANELLTLDVAWDGEQPPDIGGYVYITTDVRHHHRQNWVSLIVHGKRFFADAYPLIRSVVDAVQLEHTTFATAVRESVGQYQELLTASGRMSDNAEVGLWGELLVLHHLFATMPATRALASWRGGDQTEEHDFGLTDDDLEIKTTIGENRRHWIGSLTQLQPTPDRRLWLTSIQVTGAGVGPGYRLPDLIDQIGTGLPDNDRDTFRGRVERMGYRTTQAPDTYRLLRLRTAPATFRVDDTFPRLTRAALASGDVDATRIEQVAYTVKLDGLTPAADVPEPLTGLDKKAG
jgi:hypothetical protein